MKKKRAALLPLFLPAPAKPAFAHSPIEGIGEFYNGVLHPVLTPAHLLLLIALGLLLGRAGIKENRPAFAALAVSMLVGLLLTGVLAVRDLQPVLLCAAAVMGLLIACNASPGRLVCACSAAVTGIMVAADSAPEGLTGSSRLLALLGTGLGMLLLCLYAMGFADYFNARVWQQVGVRVVGSWLAACSLLVLALSVSRAIG
jgi:hydrogenase/urease accessory protein HupE